jgi:hypothetical protein
VFSLYGAESTLDCVRSVITLGSPVSMDAKGSQSPPLSRRSTGWFRTAWASAHAMAPRAKKLREHRRLAIPTSCLYSLGDGVVPPQEATIDGDPALHENIRVPGSHLGLGFNGIVLASGGRPPGPAGRRLAALSAQGLLAQVWRMMPRGHGSDPCHMHLTSYRCANSAKRRRLHLLGQRTRQFQRHLLHIYDQTTAPGGKVRFKQILTHVESRLSQLPVLRRRYCACRWTWTTPTGSRTRTLTSSTTCATLRCPSRATGASSVFRLRASTRGRSTCSARCGRCM